MKDSLVRAALGAILATAMGGCDSSECGEGTTRVAGACLVDSTITCGNGTVLNEDTGECVVERDCGPGTSLNPATGQCLPETTCAAGTRPIGSECVPDGSVICDDGTAFDAETGTCVIADGACGEGTTLLDGECRPDDEALSPDIPAAPEPDSPFFEGSAGHFTPPDVGAEVTLGGCVTPSDFDDDDTIDVDADYFRFDVSAPGLYRINADGLGGLAAGFYVVADGAPLEEQNWVRVGVNLVSDSSERQVFLPAAGSYTLVVFDSRSINLDSLNNQIAFLRPVGNEETCYFVTIEHIEVPTATALTESTATATLSEAPRFYSVATDGDTFFQTRISDDSPAAIGSQVLVAGDVVTHSDGLAFAGPVEDTESILVVIDHIYSIAYDDVRWTLELEEVDATPEDGEVTAVHHSTDWVFTAFDAEAGDVVHVVVEPGDLEHLVVEAIGPGLSTDTLVRISGSGNDVYYVVAQSGSQLLRFFNEDGEEGESYRFHITRIHQSPPDLTLGSVETITFADERTFARADVTSVTWANYQVRSLSGTIEGVNLIVHNDNPGVLLAGVDGVDRALSDGEEFGRIYGPAGGPETLIELNDEGDFDHDEALELRVAEAPYVDVEVLPDASVTRRRETLSADGRLFYYVYGTPGGELSFTVTGTGGTDVSITRLGALVEVMSETDDHGVDATEVFDEVMPDEGWLAFAVDAEDGGMADVRFETTPPPYGLGLGTTSFSSICPHAGGSGTVIEFVADDEEFPAADDGTSRGSFDAFSGFLFYENPVDGYVISTNGWMTFNTGYEGPDNPFDTPSRFIPDALGNEDQPNLLIAALWRDLTTNEVCTLEEAGRFIVEWNGGLFRSETAVVQMQVILLGDRSIELVYGPAHNVTDAVTVGLEDEASDRIVEASSDVRRRSSLLFTPRR